jgi:hypothetical protein
MLTVTSLLRGKVAFHGPIQPELLDDTLLPTNISTRTGHLILASLLERQDKIPRRMTAGESEAFSSP